MIDDIWNEMKWKNSTTTSFRRRHQFVVVCFFSRGMPSIYKH